MMVTLHSFNLPDDFICELRTFCTSSQVSGDDTSLLDHLQMQFTLMNVIIVITEHGLLYPG